MLRTLTRSLFIVGVFASTLWADASGPAGRYVRDVSTTSTFQSFNVRGSTVSRSLNVDKIIFNDGTIQTSSPTASSGGGSSNGSVVVYHSNGSTTTYVPSSDSDSARGTALDSAVAGAVEGDEIVLGQGNYYTTAGISMTTRFNLRGLGMDETKITIYNGGGNNFTVISSATISDLTIHGTYADYLNTIYSSGARNVNFKRVRIIGSTDPVWFDNSSVIYMEGCEIYGGLVGVQAFNSSQLYLSNCIVVADKQYDLVSGSEGTGVLANTGGVIRARNTSVFSGGFNNSNAVLISNSSPDGQVYLYDCIINSSSSVSSADLVNGSPSAGANLYVSSGTIYDPSKTSGLITLINEFSSSSGGGPTIPSTFTWTLPYGVFAGSSVVSVSETATNALDIWQGGSIYIPFYGTVYVDHGNGVRFMSNDGTQVFGYINGTGLSVGGSSVSASGLTLATGGGAGNVNNINNLNFTDATTQTTAWTGTLPSTITLSQLNGSTWTAQSPIGKDFASGYDATMTGTVLRGDGFLGVYSASFTGNASNYLRNTSVPALVNGARTWSYWMKTSSANVIPASLGTTQANNRIEAGVFQTASTWDLYGKGGGANDVTGATCTVNALDGQWHHVAFSYDGTSRTSLWVDGTLNGVARRTSGSYDTSAGIMIGIWRDLNRPMVGLVDDVALWNTQLSTAQIQSLYNGGVGNKADTIPTNLLAYYSFELTPDVSSVTVNSDWINANHSTATFNVVYSTGGSKTKWIEASSGTFSGLISGTSGYFSNIRSTTGINVGYIQGTSSLTVVSTSTLGQYAYVASSFTTGTKNIYTYNEQIESPFAAEWDDPSGSFPDEGYYWLFSVRPYKTILGTRVYSQYYSQMDFYDGGTFTQNYWCYLGWSNPGSADGYILTIENDDWNGIYGDAYYDIPAPGFAEFFYDFDGPPTYATPPSTPQSLTSISTASYVRGHQTVEYDLAVGRNLKVTGTIKSTGTITAQSRMEVVNNTVDYTNSPAIKIINASASGQNAYQNFINNKKLSVWRTDYLGGISWSAGSASEGNSYRGYHDFYVSGDYPGGTKPLTLRNPYSCADGTDSVSGCLGALMASGTDNGYATFDFNHKFLYSQKKAAWLFSPGGETTSTTTFNSMIATVTVEGTGYFQSTFTVAGALVSSSGTLNTPYFISLSTDVRDYRPAFAGVYVASASLPVNITGIGSPRDGELLRIINVSTQTISFVNQSTWSAQFNRIALSTSSSPVYISSGQTFYAIWESFTKLWRQQ